MADKHFLDYDGLSKFFNGLKQKFYQKPSGGIPKSDLALSVQNEISGKLDKSGGTMTGAISMGVTSNTRKSITMLADPTGDYDAANKKYVDDAIEDIELTDGVVRYDAVQSISETDKARARQNIGAGTYTKPANGIPKDDLANDVQTSLDKADKAVRYDAQSLTDEQKGQARGNIGAYAKPLSGIPENDLSYFVKKKLNKTNIITIESEAADPLYPMRTSKTLDEIKDEFDLNLSEQFMVHGNITYKLEKIITEDNVEKAIFYSVPQIVDNKLHYFSCEIFDTPFNYSTAEFHTYIWAGGGGLIDSVNGQTGTVVLDAEDIDVDREGIYGGTTDLEDAVNDLYKRVSSRVQIITWVNFELDMHNNELVSDLTWVQIQDAYLSGYTVQARLYIDETPMVLDYAGVSTRSGYARHVFYAATSSSIVVVEMSYNEPRDHDIELSYKPYNQDLTPYRTAAAQDIIDATKQDVIADLATIRSGAAKGATALQAVPATYRTAEEQDVIDNAKLTDAPKDGKEYARKNGRWHEVVGGGVQTVNGQTGVVVLKAENIDTNKQGQTQDFIIESNLRFNNNVKQNGINVNAVDVINALNSGNKVNISVNLSGGSIWDEQPVRYKLNGNNLTLSFLTTIGRDYSPSVVIFTGYTTSTGWSMSELPFESNVDYWYDLANSLPTGVYTIERYLEELDATKQDVVSDLDTIRSGAALGATALQSVPSTYRTAADQDIIDATKQEKLIAGTNITIAPDGKTISAITNETVISVNGEVGAVSLDATKIPTTIPSSQDATYTVEEYLEALDATKQDVISDLDTIRSGAALGATALQSVPNTYRTAAQQDIIDNGKADVADIPSLDGYATETWVESKSYLTEHQSLAAYRTAEQQDIIDATKQDVIADLATIRSGAAKGATALQAVPATYRTAEDQDVIDATKQDVVSDLDAIRSGASKGETAFNAMPLIIDYKTTSASDHRNAVDAFLDGREVKLYKDNLYIPMVSFSSTKSKFSLVTYNVNGDGKFHGVSATISLNGTRTWTESDIPNT